MTDIIAEMMPLKVHITGADIPLVDKPATPAPLRSSNRTVNISAGNPTSIAGYDPLRKELRLSVIVGPVILCDSVGDSTAAENNTGTPGTYVSPRGRILPQSTTEVCIPGPDAVWIATNSVAGQVGVTTVRVTTR
jgi:hypothetical protein